MKNRTSITHLTRLCVCALLAGVLFSCSQSESECNKVLSGKFQLRKFNVKDTKTTESSGYWFFIVGSYASKTTEQSKIRFYFLTKNGDYMFKEMDFNKVNIKIDSTVKIPFVKFYWRDNCNYHGYSIYEQLITRVVIYCRDEDFKPEININELR